MCPEKQHLFRRRPGPLQRSSPNDFPTRPLLTSHFRHHSSRSQQDFPQMLSNNRVGMLGRGVFLGTEKVSVTLVGIHQETVKQSAGIWEPSSPAVTCPFGMRKDLHQGLSAGFGSLSWKIHKDHPVQILLLPRHSNNPTLCLGVVQRFLELFPPHGSAHSLCSSWHPLGEETFPCLQPNPLQSSRPAAKYCSPPTYLLRMIQPPVSCLHHPQDD